MIVPTDDGLRRLGRQAKLDTDTLLRFAADRRRALQDAQAELDAVDVGPEDPAYVAARRRLEHEAAALRDVQRGLTLALCDLTPPGSERAPAARRVAAVVRLMAA